MLRGLIGEHIDLTITTTDVGHVRIAASQVEQVVINLVVNARDAIPAGGTIRIETANVNVSADPIGGHLEVKPGSYVALGVTDDGTGMPPEVAERVFDPFFTTKGPDEGTGLGLATVHGIVTGAGGHVWVYTSEGVGTTFRILLPQTEETAAESFPGRRSRARRRDDPARRGRGPRPRPCDAGPRAEPGSRSSRPRARMRRWTSRRATPAASTSS